MTKRICWTLAAICVAIHNGSVFADSPKGVSVTLRAKWPGTPILLEAAECLVRPSRLASRMMVDVGPVPGKHRDVLLCRHLRAQRLSGLSSTLGKSLARSQRKAAGARSMQAPVSTYQVGLPCY